MFGKRKDPERRRSDDDRRGLKKSFAELSPARKVLRVLWWMSIVLPLSTFLWRYFIRRLLMCTGIAVVLLVAGYFSFETVTNYVDENGWVDFDKHLGTDKEAVLRLHDPAYFAQQS